MKLENVIFEESTFNLLVSRYQETNAIAILIQETDEDYAEPITVIYYYFENKEFPNLTFEDLKFTKQEIKDYYNLPNYKELEKFRSIAIKKEFDNEFIDNHQTYTRDKTPIKLILTENSDIYNYENRKFGSASIQYKGKPFIREIYPF